VTKEKRVNGRPAVQLTAKGIIVWGGLIVFMMGWMFVLGILVGRGPVTVVNLTNQLFEKGTAVQRLIGNALSLEGVAATEQK